jgi:hypothetical protein
MFYSTELSRNGKTPLARMWQACHGIKMHKKVVEDFNIESSHPSLPYSSSICLPCHYDRRQLRQAPCFAMM